MIRHTHTYTFCQAQGNLVRGTPCHPPMVSKPEPPSCCDEAGHRVDAERAVNRGLISLGQQMIESHCSVLWVSRGDLENTGGRQGTVVCRHLELCPGKQEPDASAFTPETCWACSVPFPSGARVRNRPCPEQLRTGVRHGVWG